jgi:hypothetical protein
MEVSQSSNTSSIPVSATKSTFLLSITYAHPVIQRALYDVTKNVTFLLHELIPPLDGIPDLFGARMVVEACCINFLRRERVAQPGLDVRAVSSGIFWRRSLGAFFPAFLPANPVIRKCITVRAT